MLPQTVFYSGEVTAAFLSPLRNNSYANANGCKVSTINVLLMLLDVCVCVCVCVSVCVCVCVCVCV